MSLTTEQKSAFEKVASAKFYSDPVLMHDTFSRMRDEAPVCWLEPQNYRPFWAVTRYEDIREILRDSETFISAPRRQLFDLPTEKAMVARSGNAYGLSLRTLTDMDEPDHSAYRNFTKDWFSTKSVRELKESIQEIAVEFADRMVEMDGKCDFVNDIALWYPLRVIMELMGIPREDDRKMLDWTMQLFGFEDEELSRDGAANASQSGKSAGATLDDFFAYFAAITKDRQKNPRNDLCSILANASIADKPMPTMELFSYYVIAATAGHDTTSSSSSAAMLALIENPSELEKVLANHDIIPTMVTESIRWASPVRHFCRTATKDYELRGQTIKKGETVVVFHPSGNRDSEEFDSPFEFKADRRPNRLISFGYGIHVCLGQHLAKLEIATLYEEIFKRIENIELDGEPTWASNLFIGGLKSLPIKYTIKPEYQKTNHAVSEEATVA